MASDSEWVPSDSDSSSLKDDVELEDELYEGLPRQYTSKLSVSSKKPPRPMEHDLIPSQPFDEIPSQPNEIPPEPENEVVERLAEPHDIPPEPQDETPTELQVKRSAEPQDMDLLPEPQDEMLVDDSQEHFPEEIPQLESPIKRGRKKLRKENEWLRNKRKKLKNEGKSYLSSRKRVVPEKIFAAVDCNCRMKCLHKFDYPEVLQDFFNTFWKLGDYSKQNAFLRGMVGKKVPLRVRPRDNSSTPKSTVFQYVIPTGKEDIKVCKKFFLSVLKISWGRLYKCLTAEEAFGVLDGRGKSKPINKIDDSYVVAHIRSFPAYQSHYTRKDNINKKYLHCDLNVRKMYDLYVKNCSEEHKEPVKLKYYYQVFSSKFNLHFKPPSKDTCKDCDALEIQINAETDEAKRQDLLTTKDNHLILAETAREVLSNDEAAASHDTYVCTYDLQKALPFPKLSTSVAYYKRNMYMYNFGVHSFNDSTAHMYVYDETEGGRGAEDISSCLTKHLRENAKEHKNIVLFSDSCGGQNRNIKTSVTMLKLVQDPAIKAEQIDLKYMVPGHSFLPNDTDFGMIERASQKNHQIWEPQTWIDIIKTSKHKQPHFKVHPMSRDEFLSTKALEEAITNRKNDIDGNAVNWLKIRWLRFQRSKPFEIQFKHSFEKDAPFRTINVKQIEVTKRRKNTKPQKGLKLKSLFEVKQEPLYPNRRAMDIAKKKDMLSLLQFIPRCHHGYFKNLPVDVATRSKRPADINEEDDDNDEVIYE